MTNRDDDPDGLSRKLSLSTFFALFLAPLFLLAPTAQAGKNAVGAGSAPDIDRITPGFDRVRSDRSWVVIPMPAYQQTTEYSCGPAAAMTVAVRLGAMGRSELTRETELQVSEDVGANEVVGAMPWGLEAWFVDLGLDATSGKNPSLEFLVDNLRQGRLTVVAWSAWGGHWSTVIGYQESTGKLALSDPADEADDRRDGVVYVDAEKFLRQWHTPPFRQATRGAYVLVGK